MFSFLSGLGVCVIEALSRIAFTFLNTIELVIKVLFKDTVVPFLYGNKNRIENVKAYNPDDASLDQLSYFLNVLKYIKKELNKNINEIIENNITSYSKELFDSIDKFIIEDVCSKGVNIDTNYLRFNFDKFINNLKNSFSDNIDRRISLSDNKCIEILSIEDLSLRSSSMNEYIDEIIYEYLDGYFKDLDLITNNTMDFIYRSIERTKESYLDQTEYIKRELEQNANLNYDEIEKKRDEYMNREKLIINFIELLKN